MGSIVGFELEPRFIRCTALYHHTRTMFAVLFFKTILCLLFHHNDSMRMHMKCGNDIYIVQQFFTRGNKFFVLQPIYL